ncbi:unnamed protein product [Rotaria sp. Silwood2]|nr:unnamed protein product [Rotaria sp. Silwood2]CAF4167012.1 unnamed protein product [Rotaria sp. Silwood2]CAF4370943.1 unnamed protein product [Rotaria sp. Silwood2]
MDQMKRKLSLNQSLKEEIKKLRNECDRSITCIESLPMEFFYEVFDYLDGYAIHKAFSNLNHRFQQILNSPSLLFKIKIHHLKYKEGHRNSYKKFLCRNMHKIVSIKVCLSIQIDTFFLWFTIKPSLSALESLRIYDIESIRLISLLINLASLPRLFSLNIKTSNTYENLHDIYRLLFTLPTLKWCRFIFHRKNSLFSLPMAINKQQSTIEYFSIHHRCTLNELYAIISYTPQLRRLNLCHKFEIDSNIRTILPITLSNLTNVSIHMHHEKFDEFEIFIRKICSKLKILRVNTYSQDIAFLNAYRWEKLILQSLSQLEEFYLRYYERAGPVHKYPMYNGQLNQFVSSFWIERQWIFETEINSESIIYLVGPYRKRWYENTQDKICNCSRDLFKSTRLTLKYSDSDDNKKLVTIATKRILTVTQVYDLEILEEKYFIGALIKIINLLPENVKFEERFIFSSIEDTSKITNVYLEKMNEIEEFSFLSELCPYMKSLKVDYIKYMDVKFVLRYIFKKIKEDCNEHLCLLCLHIPTVDDEMIGKLKRMINFEKLLFNYTIKRVADHMYIEWE